MSGVSNISKPRRHNFKISYCSSEDLQFPANELLLQSPESKGWQSARFSSYPQLVVLQMNEIILLKQCTLLAHEFKIPTRIDIECKVNMTDPWQKLGYTALQSNVSTSYKSRELRTVNLSPVQAAYVRLSIHQNYPNPSNIFNQVGLIALCLYGNRLNSEDQLSPVQLDKGTASILKRLEEAKAKALDEDNFERAKQIKDDINKILKNAAALFELQKMKKEAIENDNFEEAKRCHQRMNRLRGSLDSPLSPDAQVLNPVEFQLGRSKSPFIVRKQEPRRNRSVLVNPEEMPIRPAASFVPEKDPEEPQLPDQLRELTPQQYAEASRHFPVFNEVIFQHLYSKYHPHRLRALDLLQDAMSELNSSTNLTEAALLASRILLQDKVAAVLLRAVDFYGLMMKKCRPDDASHLLLNVLEILKSLVNFLGHQNEKLRERAYDVLEAAPGHALTHKGRVIEALLSAKKDTVKMNLSRLALITAIRKQYGVSNEHHEAQMQLAEKLVLDKNTEVKEAASRLLQALNIGGGAQMERQRQKETPRRGQNKLPPNRSVDMQPVEPSRRKRMRYSQESPKENVTRSYEPKNPQYLCDFCGIKDKRLEGEQFRDRHMFEQCLMLIQCEMCRQVIEVSTLNSHRLSECSKQQYYKRCPKCREAVPTSSYQEHVQKKQCLAIKPVSQANRCPLCHEDIRPELKGWRLHLVEQECPMHPRGRIGRH